MQDTTEKTTASAQDIVDSMKPKAPSRRYDSLSFSVSSLNEQIEELNHANERLEDNIEVWEAEIRRAQKQVIKNTKQSEKLRAKRQIVAEAAFKAAAIDQP